MAKYKIIPSSRTIVQSPISIGHKAEKGVEAIEFDLTAWVETYGSGTLTVIMRRWGDTIPYPIALEIDENNKATWTLSDMDTAKAGMAYAQLNYIVGETVVKKSDIYTFRVMDSLTGEGDPPEAYESWLEQLTHLAAEAMAEVLDIEGIVTDKTLTVDGGIADAKKVGDELGAINESLGAYASLSTSKRTTIPDNTDLNDLTTPGQYKVGTLAKARTIINIPYEIAGVLDVGTATSGTTIIQEYQTISSSRTGHMYRRTKSGSGGWTAWVYCVDSGDLSEMETRLLANIKGNNLSNIGTASAIPRFRLISGYVKTDVISDYKGIDGIRYNQIQGIASDKNRYLFWCLRRPPVATGDSNPMLLRKWDTWRNESVVLNTNAPQAYGHAEDMEYIPKWCKGFDNGSVDRLYIVDMDRYAPNKTIHVVNADTLEYITSFETANLLPKGLASPEHWSGANHIAFDPMRGKIVLNSVFTPEGTVEHYVITAIYDKDGNFEKGLEFRRYAGTQLGMDCDENYIYIPNYESSPTVEGELDHYIYIFDWDLNPITRFMIDREFWEFEGIAHIGKKFYTSWIADQSSYGIRIVENQPLVTDYALSTTFPLHAWGDSDNFRLSTFRYINPSN